MKTILKMIFVLALTASCESKVTAKFIVENKTDFTIDSLSFEPDSKSQFFSLAPGSRLNLQTNMDTVNMDGSFRVHFRNASTKVWTHQNFGYYSNGMPLEDYIQLTIQTDTIIVEYQ